VVSPSAHQAERLRAAGLDRVAVVPNTVTASGRPARPLDRVDGPLRIIWIGRCEPEKRILPFVRALAAAQRELGRGRLHGVVVGDGSQLAEARQAAGDAEIDFLGRQDHDRVPELLARAHLVALTSYGFDNQPMTIVEAVAAGRGVLYCDPALSEGLAGPGIQVPAAEAGISAALVDLVERPDRVLAASRATEQARTEFAPETHARRMFDLYDDAIRRVRADRSAPGTPTTPAAAGGRS
jgi:glycosyltransferase involved in cell wall biosynthesis